VSKNWLEEPMNLQEYFEVAHENAKQAIAKPSDLRLAINAILTLDGFFGTLHAELFERGIVQEPRDDRWKETIAEASKSYRVLRDAAYALKHGVLTHSKPRLVRRSEHIHTLPTSFDSATFDRDTFDTEQVWIEGCDTDYRADEVITIVVELAKERCGPIVAAGRPGDSQS
jgi:hypothetical protein